MADVFISYSRADVAFAEQLHDALARQGFDVWRDLEDLPYGTRWWQQIREAIEAADNVLVVLTPNWLESPTCREELEYAVQHHKRLLPIVSRPVDGQLVPEALAAINYLYFPTSADPESAEFTAGVGQLIETLRMDEEWVQFHTWLLQRAREWEEAGSDPSRLLGGSTLASAEQRLAEGAEKEPAPTALQTQFVLASRKTSSSRQRTLLGAVTTALLLMGVLALVAWQQRELAIRNQAAAQDSAQVAQAQRDTARQQRMLAEQREQEAEESARVAREQRELAEQQQRLAEANAEEARRQQQVAQQRHRIALARQLAAEASITLDRAPDRMDLALSLATEAVRLHPSAETRRALRPLLALQPRALLVADLGEEVRTIAFHPRGHSLAVGGYRGGVEMRDARRAAGPPGGPEPQANSSRLWRAQLEARVRGLAFTPAGDRLAVAAGTGVSILGAESGNVLFSLEAADTVWALAMHPGGQLLAAGADDGRLQVWSLQDGREVMRVEGDSELQAVAFSRDGRWLASLSEDGLLCLYETARGAESQRCRGTGGSGLYLAWAPDNERILTASENYALLWDLDGDAPLARMEHVDATGTALAAHHIWLTDAVFSPDGRLIATAGGDFTVRVWDASTGQELSRMLHTAEVWAVRFSPDGRSLATASLDGTVRIWDALRGVERLRGTYVGSAVAVEFDPAGGRLAAGFTTGDFRGFAVLWEPSAGDELLRLPHRLGLRDLHLSHDGARMATVDDDGWVHLWNARNGTLLGRARPGFRLQRVRFIEGSDRLVAWRPDDNAYLLSASAAAGDELSAVQLLSRPQGGMTTVIGRRNVIVHHASAFHLLHAITGDTLVRIDAPRSNGEMRLSADERYLVAELAGASESAPLEIAVFELPAGREMVRFTVPDWQLGGRQVRGSVVDFDVASGGRRVAVVTSMRLWLWEIEEGAIRRGRELGRDVGAVRFSPDGSRLLTLSDRRTELIVWDSRSGARLARILHEDRIYATQFAPDGEVFLTIASGRARVWRTGTGELISELPGVSQAYFSGDGRYLITADRDGAAVLRIWRTEDLMRAACAHILEPISREEWQQYLPGEPYQPACAR